MCDWCKACSFLAREEETDTKGITTVTGVSISGNKISVERKQFSKKGIMVGYKLLTWGLIRFCPMCGERLKGV